MKILYLIVVACTATHTLSQNIQPNTATGVPNYGYYGNVDYNSQSPNNNPNFPTGSNVNLNGNLNANGVLNKGLNYLRDGKDALLSKVDGAIQNGANNINSNYPNSLNVPGNVLNNGGISYPGPVDSSANSFRGQTDVLSKFSNAVQNGANNINSNYYPNSFTPGNVLNNGGISSPGSAPVDFSANSFRGPTDVLSKVGNAIQNGANNLNSNYYPNSYDTRGNVLNNGGISSPGSTPVDLSANSFRGPTDALSKVGNAIQNGANNLNSNYYPNSYDTRGNVLNNGGISSPGSVNNINSNYYPNSFNTPGNVLNNGGISSPGSLPVDYSNNAINGQPKPNPIFSVIKAVGEGTKSLGTGVGSAVVSGINAFGSGSKDGLLSGIIRGNSAFGVGVVDALKSGSGAFHNTLSGGQQPASTGSGGGLGGLVPKIPFLSGIFSKK